MEEQRFYVLKDAEGVFRPMAFITSIDKYGTGEGRKELYSKKLDEGESIVTVSFVEIN